MDMFTRIKIIQDAEVRIKDKYKNFQNYESGHKEVIYDEYLAVICKENNSTLSEFYNCDGNILINLFEMYFKR
jgi:hypothetical protein